MTTNKCHIIFVLENKDFERLFINGEDIKMVPTTGFEPEIFGLEGLRLIYLATKVHDALTENGFFFNYFKYISFRSFLNSNEGVFTENSRWCGIQILPFQTTSFSDVRTFNVFKDAL